MKTSKILLISPVRERDIFCGDVIYTETLLANPPAGFEYVTYVEALRRGWIIERKRLRCLPNLWRNERALFWADVLPALGIFLLNILRKAHLLLNNPWRFYYLKHDFALVHNNVFPINLSGRETPLVMSTELPMQLFLQYAKKYSKLRIALTCGIEKWLMQKFLVQDAAFNLAAGTKVMLASERLAPYFQTVAKRNRQVVFPGLAPVLGKIPAKKEKNYFQLGFIAKDFELKGGRELLAAYYRLRQKLGEQIKLTIVGSIPKISSQQCEQLGITWLTYVERQKLLRQIVPTFDLFVYLTKLDGLAKVVLEMLSLGVPCVVSDFLALPDMIEAGYAGAVVKETGAPALAATLESLLNKNKLKLLSKQAYELFQRKYHIAVGRKKLGAFYVQALL